MAKIYLIINTKNNKKYVGQTTGNVSQRFCQHIDASYRKDADKKRSEFYKDIKESGENVFEQFKYKILEECENKDKLKREVFYISKILPEYNENYKSQYIKSITETIIDEYSKGNNITDIRKKYKCRHQLISLIIKEAIKEGKIKKHNSCSTRKKVYMFDDDGKVKKEWLCAGDCSRELKIDRGNIRLCSLRNTKENLLYFTAEGYHFKYNKETPKDMYQIKNKQTQEIKTFKTKEAFIDYFKKEFPNKNILYGQLVRYRKSVYGYEIKKLYEHRN